MKKDSKKHEKKAIKNISLAKKKLIVAEKTVKKYIKTHPVKAAAIAAGVAAAIAGITAGTAYLVKKKRR